MDHMNEGQQKFLSFILERVQEDKVEEARTILAENFKKQAEGSFSPEDIKAFIPKMMSLLKPDKIEEVQNIVRQFSSKMQG